MQPESPRLLQPFHSLIWRLIRAMRAMAPVFLVLSMAPAMAERPARSIGCPTDGPIVVGILADYSPFQQWPATQSAPIGYDVDLLEQLAPTLKCEVRYQRFAAFDDLLNALRSGQVDVVSSMARTLQRETEFAFTRHYVAQQQAMIGRAETTSLPDAPDLAGRRLALVAQYASAVAAADRWPLAQRVMRPDSRAALDAVAQGSADLTFESLPNGVKLMAQHPDLRVLRTFSFPVGHLRLAVRKGRTALLDRLDHAIATRTPDGVETLAKRWLVDTSMPAPDTDRRPEVVVAPLKVGYFRDDPPFTVQGNDGKPQGVAIELVRAVANRAGLKIGSFHAVGLSDGLEAVRTGALDILLGPPETEQRAKEFDLVGPYRSAPLGIVSNRRYSVWDLAQLAGRRLALVQGFFARDFVRRLHPDVQIVDCAHLDTCLGMIERGEADATLYGLQGLSEQVQIAGRSGLAITGVVDGLFDEDNLVLAKGRPDLVQRLHRALDGAKRDDLPAIEASWASAALRPDTVWTEMRQWLSAAGAVLLFGTLAWWLHSRGLQRESRRAELAREEAEQYLAFMTHEVRNALQSVSGAVTLLGQDRNPSAAPATTRPAGRVTGTIDNSSLLRALSNSARSTLGLLDGLLERHRLKEGKFSLRPNPEDLDRLLRDLVDELQPAAQGKGLRLCLTLPPAAATTPRLWHLDALRLQQVLRNLLVNAVKFSDAGDITLSLTWTPSPRGGAWSQAVLQVADQGPGLDEQEQKLLFERLRTSGGDRPGSGLGLNLSRDLAEAMGGTLTVEGLPGVGSCFTLRIDLLACASPSRAAAPRHLHHVLLVEDEEVQALLLQVAFERVGIRVTVVSTFEAALDTLQRLKPQPDVVVSDVRLDDGHIDQLIDGRGRLPRTVGNAPPPLIAISTDLDPDTEARLRARGVDATLAKTADAHLLVEQIRTFVERASD